MKNIIYYSLLIFFCSCNEGEVYKCKADKNKSNLKFYAGTVYYGEVIQIKYNDELILRHKMDSVSGFPYAFQYFKEFNIPFTDKFSFSITTKFNGKTYIDTTIVGSKNDFGYHLTLSRSLPLDWGESYFDEGKIEPKKKWSYLPIDSSMRTISFKSDTVYKDNWTDIVN